MWTNSIQKPTLILNESICRENIQRMAEKAQKNNVRFHPHFKTHQSAEIGEWFREADVEAITVSSVDMAIYFADHGWNDITIAFTVNLRQIEAINTLASRVQLGLIVESLETIRVLQDKLTHPVKLWLDVDTGYHRTGIDWQEEAAIIELAQQIQSSPNTRLIGLLTHAGHTYKAKTHAEIESIHRETVERLNHVRDLLADNNISDLDISIGDTPSCSVVEDLGKIDEIRPGNFAFYDVMQHDIGSCQLEDIAVAVACPVVAKQHHLKQIVVYGGAVHLSKDQIVDRQGRTNFGLIAMPTENGWQVVNDASYVKGLSQEHGLIHADQTLMESINIGDILLILPIHSCHTANLLKQYQLLDGKSIAMAPIPTISA